MSSVFQVFTNFFHKNDQLILQNYPGLTLERLLHDYCFYKKIEKHHYFFDQNFLQQLQQGMPLAYIFGKKYFFNSDFIVNSDVLIPRQETEILVEMAIKEVKKIKKENISYLEVGVGTGAISLSLLKEISQKISMTLTDISHEALAVCQRNYFLHQFSFPINHQVEFIQTDRLKGIKQSFDLIISNPPYIPDNSTTVHAKVHEYEPHLALYLKQDEYDHWFKQFFSDVLSHLNPGGVFLMEGHEDYLEKLATFLTKGNIEILRDLTGRKRFIKLYI
jgi:release factor glutamine methyltransferase